MERLALTEADLVTVAELACHEPGCPPVETVVAVHGPDGISRTWRVHKALAEIEQPDMLARSQATLAFVRQARSSHSSRA